ncbi:MAG: mechanosensitive ion channel [Balneolaceae bacterium]|nr:mechanosensitive ion channel [Balneolaceae bacterium]
MEEIQQSFTRFWTQIKESAPEILLGFLVMGIFVLVGNMLSRGLKKVMDTSRTSQNKAHLIRRLVRWTLNIIGFAIALNIMGLTKVASGILAAGGILTVVLGFAFREIGENLLAGLFMSFNRSFDVGDLIESNGTRGIVKQINIRDVQVRTGDGVDIFIPSALVFKNTLQNFTKDGLRRGSCVIGIDYRNDSNTARRLILESIQDISGVLGDPAPSVQMQNFSENYVELEIFFWINTFGEHTLRKVQTQVMEATRQALLENGYTVSSEVSTAVEVTQKNQ